MFAVKPTKKDKENQDKELINCKSNEIKNIIQWAANGTKMKEKEQTEVDGPDKIFMISNTAEKGKEPSLKEENIDESTSDDESSCESVQS